MRDDVLAWIRDQRQTRNRWDLIFVDPPTFSNSSKMGRRTWDVQRDHVELLAGVSRLLAQGGHAIFSCNLRGFRPETRKLARAGVVLEDITAQTIPEDFARNQKVHHCYIVRRLPIEDAMAEVGFSAEEIAERLDMPVDKVREIMRVAQEPVSLETPIGEEEDSHLGDFIPDDDAPVPAEAASQTLLKEQLADVLKTLTPREDPDAKPAEDQPAVQPVEQAETAEAAEPAEPAEAVDAAPQEAPAPETPDEGEANQ